MKRFAFALGLSFSLVLNAFAAEPDSVLDTLNSQIVNMLAPFQNERTTTQLIFDNLEMNQERVLKAAAHVFYYKVGSKNTIKLVLDHLNYNYGDGSTPTTTIKGMLTLDLTKMMPVSYINTAIPELSHTVETVFQNHTEYGHAASARGVVTSTTKDAHGHCTGITALITIKIDLDNLPQEQLKEQIPFTELVATVNIEMKKGISFDAYVISNPNYFEFQKDAMGLKELIDQVMSGSGYMMRIATILMKDLDENITDLVEG